MSALQTVKQSDVDLVHVLQNSLYPGAEIGSVQMVLNYCAAAGLDPMQKPVHIVPIWDGKAKRMRDVIMPGIGLYRTQAARSGNYAGVSEAEYGPDVTEKIGGVEVTYPVWCKVTVKRLLGNQVVEFAAREFWKENYATAGKDSSAPNAMWKKRPYGQIAKCFDAETEVLTTNGFEKFSAVTGRILQVTDSGLDACDSMPFVQDYDGEMIVADGSRLNFSVTPNHDMLTTEGKIEAGKMFEQSTQIAKFIIPRAPSGSRPDAPIPDNILRLAGVFLADGSHTGYRQMRVAVSRQWKIDALRELALESSEGVKLDAGRVAVANGREIFTAFDKAQFVYNFDLVSWLVTPAKAIVTDAALSLSQRQARIVVDSLVEFDGSDNGNGVRRLTQSNKNVLAAFEVLAVQAGYSLSARVRRDSDIGSSFSVTVSDASGFPVVRGSTRNKASLVKRKNVNGKVWCVTVPSGVIVVRRHGFSMLCGNCAEAQALRKAFPEFGSAATADEMEGKEIDMGTAEIVQETKPTELPAYQQEDFAANLPTWKKSIDDGRISAEQVIVRVSSKYRLSEEQKAAIRALESKEEEPQREAIDGEFLAAYDKENGDA